MKFKAVVTGQSSNMVKAEVNGQPIVFNVGSLRLERVNDAARPRHVGGEVSVSGDDPAAAAAEGLILGAVVDVTITPQVS